MEAENLNPQIPPQHPMPNHFPKLTVVIIGVVLLGVIISGVSYFKNPKPITQKQNHKSQQEQLVKNITPSPASPPSTTPATQVSSEQAARDNELIKQVLIKNYSAYNEQDKVRINYDDGRYASGRVDRPGMGILIAAKVNGVWEIIVPGAQQALPCSWLVNYPDLPNTIMPACYDKNGYEIKR